MSTNSKMTVSWKSIQAFANCVYLITFIATACLMSDFMCLGNVNKPSEKGEVLDKDIPIIIWWSGRLFLDDNTRELSCPKFTCYSTKRREHLSDPRARAIYFYGTDLEPEDLPLPRLPWHEWALLHEESPMNNYMLSHAVMIKLFNHTATFRRESDFPLTSGSLPSLDYLTSRKPISINTKNKLQSDKGLAPVLYVQSHCHVASDRDRYVKELMKYLEVDSYGKCVNNKPIPMEMSDPVESMEAEDFLDFIAQYKFHLAFENAICKDYMTEKLFRPLHVGSVPIYRGSPDVKDWMPNNHSVIVVDDFVSPEALASFIISLDKDDEAYEKYLSYKEKSVTNEFLLRHMKTRKYGVTSYSYEQPDMLSAFECHICEQISERYNMERKQEKYPDTAPLPPKVASPLHLSCPQPYTSLGNPDDLTTDDEWKQFNWVEDYWSGFDKALTVKKMLLLNLTNSKNFEAMWHEMVMDRYSKGMQP